MIPAALQNAIARAFGAQGWLWHTDPVAQTLIIG